jgi:hypothetical protein
MFLSDSQAKKISDQLICVQSLFVAINRLETISDNDGSQLVAMNSIMSNAEYLQDTLHRLLGERSQELAMSE